MQHALSVIAPALLALVVYPAATGLLNWYLWWDTPAAWDAFAAAYPKRAKWVRILRAINPHFHKLAEVWRDEAAKRSAVPPSVGPLAPSDPVALPLPTPAEPSPVLRAVTVSYRPQPMPPPSDDGNAAAYELARREAASARVFDPLARQTIAPEAIAAAKGARDQGGHVEGAAMLGACIVALAASLLCAGCPWVREGAMRASVVVTDPTDCVPLATRCVAGVPVICSPSPVPGSTRHREWPLLPRDGRGSQRACSGGCVVDDAGAHCVAADAAVDADGGGL